MCCSCKCEHSWARVCSFDDSLISVIALIYHSNRICRGHWRDELDGKTPESAASGSLLDRCQWGRSREAAWLQPLTYIQSEGSNAYYVNSSNIFSGKLCQLFRPGLYCWTNPCPIYLHLSLSLSPDNAVLVTFVQSVTVPSNYPLSNYPQMHTVSWMFACLLTYTGYKKCPPPVVLFAVTNQSAIQLCDFETTQ